MKILLLTGNHPRHLYLADNLSNLGLEIILNFTSIRNYIKKICYEKYFEYRNYWLWEAC